MRITRKQLRRIIRESIYDPNKLLGKHATSTVYKGTEPEEDEDILRRMDKFDPSGGISQHLGDIYTAGEEMQADELASSLDPGPYDTLHGYSRGGHRTALFNQLPWSEYGSIPSWVPDHMAYKGKLGWAEYTDNRRKENPFKNWDNPSWRKEYKEWSDKNKSHAFQKISELFKKFKPDKDEKIKTVYPSDENEWPNRSRPTNMQKGTLFGFPTLATWEIARKWYYEVEDDPSMLGKPIPESIVFYAFKEK